MRFSLRFIIPLAVALAAIAYAVVPLVDNLTLKWFVRDLDIRTKLIATAVQEPFVELLTERTRDKVRLERVQALFNRILQDERLFALGFCDAAGRSYTRRRRFPGTAPAAHTTPLPRKPDACSGTRTGRFTYHRTRSCSRAGNLGSC